MTACKSIEEILEKVVHGCGVRGQVCGMHPLDYGTVEVVMVEGERKDLFMTEIPI